MHKVRISFDRPSDMIIELNDEQYAAAMDEDDWQDFYSLCESELAEHLFAFTSIDDIRDTR